MTSLQTQIDSLREQITKIDAPRKALRSEDQAPPLTPPSGSQDVLPFKHRALAVVLPAVVIILSRFLWWILIGKYLSRAETRELIPNSAHLREL